MRVQENPALDVAVHYANQLGLPLLVYQGLSEKYPYASDRHHTFVLQGARDLQQECADQNIRYALHVERDRDRGSHLRTLADRSAIVVTEDMPTAFLQRWTRSLARSLDTTTILSVDTACVVPMQLVGRAHDRAFQFRDATRKLFKQRVSARDNPVDSARMFTERLPFEPVNLQADSIAKIISECDVDHTIAAVADTIGGSRAGYRRWSQFLGTGISRYDRTRNNALVDGVSRMSAYLHYGMVAPTRIAREAKSRGGKGAEKYLDELLIWRELAYSFCYFRPDHQRLSAIPSWARESLARHTADPRPSLQSWESMARGDTGDAIWDAAQKSLLIHGELHNNVRMTWGKAILNWTPDPSSALRRIIDLNHRYALDGRDPASYGGILWCLGQFDRPFSPPQPITGTVRTRTTIEHAKRLDPISFRKKTTRCLWSQRPRIAIVGAGISGLTCGRILSDHGCEVTIFEKSRGVSGRMSTRRESETLIFDHGAQYFTARSKIFRRYAKSWLQDKIIQTWNGKIAVIEKGREKPGKAGPTRYVATPGMNTLGKHLADGLIVQKQTHVQRIERTSSQWRLISNQEKALGNFDWTILALPAHQAAVLATDVSPSVAAAASTCIMDACWALMVGFERRLPVPYDAAFVHNSPLSWICRNNSKPGRAQELENWTIHTTANWSEENLEREPAEVGEALLNEFWTATGLNHVAPVHRRTHRWRYAIPRQSLPKKYLLDQRNTLMACGDWCGGPRVEGAFLSGAATAGRLLGILNETLTPGGQVGSEQLALFD